MDRYGICVVVELPESESPSFVADLATRSDLTVYFQSRDSRTVREVRQRAEAAALLGHRVFVEQGSGDRIHLADNLAELVVSSVFGGEREALRVLHPRGKALLLKNNATRIKEPAIGVDAWSHPYHSPDNNPVSTDALARSPYITQFLAEPLLCPMPAISVIAGGRAYKAFGSIARHANQNDLLNTLLCVNAYNGMVLWKRPLKEGFMIHRNTMVATVDHLYLADDESCKVIDGATGKTLREIKIPDGVGDGPVWKWMALENGVLYVLSGGQEVKSPRSPSENPGFGGWSWENDPQPEKRKVFLAKRKQKDYVFKGYFYEDPKSNFGYGRMFSAINTTNGQVLWRYDTHEYLDSRGVCMKNGRVFFCSPEKYLAALDAKAGDLLWKRDDAEFLKSLGVTGECQFWRTGFASSTYIKCNDPYVFLAGPHRPNLVVMSAVDGRTVWQKKTETPKHLGEMGFDYGGNFQLVLHKDAMYAIGWGGENASIKFDYDTGKELARFPSRTSCARASGSLDTVFFRVCSGNTAYIDTATDALRLNPMMRPPCHDGVLIANGLVYWSPWMCQCPMSLYGHIALTSAKGFSLPQTNPEIRVEYRAEDLAVKGDQRPGDWPCYQGDSAHSCQTSLLPNRVVRQKWVCAVPHGSRPTAPIAANGMVFYGDQTGILHAVDAATGQRKWKFHTGGAILQSPSFSEGRLFVPSADGQLYALEAQTGREWWRFHAAPADRIIPVYGKLRSTWPLSGGVLVEQGVVYTAAGISC